MSDEYQMRNIDLGKLAEHVRNNDGLSETPTLHLLDTIKCLQSEIAGLRQKAGELEQGFIGGIYMGACYCQSDHECTPCRIKRRIATDVRIVSLEQERDEAIASAVCRNCYREAWSRNIPNEQALWWWWNEDGPPIVVSIFASGHENVRYFATQGQHGWNRAQWVEDMGGYWMRCREPEWPPRRAEFGKGEEE